MTKNWLFEYQKVFHYIKEFKIYISNKKNNINTLFKKKIIIFHN